MNLEKGETIFDKINISYDTLRNKKNPIKSFTDYYKSKLKPGQDLWWIDQNNEKASNLVINIWNNLGATEKARYKKQGDGFFQKFLVIEVINLLDLPFGLLLKKPLFVQILEIYLLQVEKIIM
ncbi:MAG: hypothetical protein R2781_08150 [Flavobacteriaceae bacterium]